MKLAIQVFAGEVLAVALVGALLVGGAYGRYRDASRDYTEIIALNWNLYLPSPTDALYATNDGYSTQGDGLRYHVLQYGVSQDPGGALPWRWGAAEAIDHQAREIWERLAVPPEWRPRLTGEYRWLSVTSRRDGVSKLYLIWDGTARRLCVAELIF